MSLSTILTEDRRLVILRSLHEANGNHLNDSMLKKLLSMWGHDMGGDLVRAEVRWLEDLHLVRVSVLVDPPRPDMWVVHLLEGGEDVALGRRTVPGIARPSPG